MADDRVRLEVTGRIATISNNNPDKHNAFDDAMFEILGGLRDRRDVRAERRSRASARGGLAGGAKHLARPWRAAQPRVSARRSRGRRGAPRGR